MQLDPDAFAQHLDGFAEPFLFSKAYACPCLNPSSGSPRANCPHCGGRGWLWGAARDVTAAVASSGIQQQWAKFGTHETGDMVLSIPHTSGLYEIAQFDRVVHMTNSDEKSIALIRGNGADRLAGRVKAIRRVFWFDQAEAIVEGAIPSVAGDGRLTWPAAGPGVNVPDAGQAFSITYERYAEYFCFGEFSVDRMKHGGSKLPRRMVLRRMDLMARARTASKTV